MRPDAPPPWTDDVNAEMHADAAAIVAARRDFPTIKEVHVRNAAEKALKQAEQDFVDAMVAHGKGSHSWPDGLRVRLKWNVRNDNQRPTLYVEKSTT